MAIEYTVDRRSGVVKSKLEGCKFDAVIKILKSLNIQIDDEGNAVNGEIPSHLELALMKDIFSGKSKCHEDDNFDEAEGKRVASERMMKKYNSSKDRAVRRFYKAMKKDISLIEDLMRRMHMEY